MQAGRSARSSGRWLQTCDTLEVTNAQPFVPSVFLLVPGPWETEALLREALATVTLSLGTFDGGPIAADHVRFGLVHDPAGFGNALSWSRDGQRDELVGAANNCTAAALVEIGTTLDLAVPALRPISEALRNAGGVGVRVESSGAAVDWPTWFAALDAETAHELVHHTTLLVANKDVSYTTGMHAFLRPDALVHGHDPDLLSIFCGHQVVEDPALLTGHTFAAEGDQPSRALQRWPDYRFTPDDGRYNPFGLWRMTEPGVAGLGATDPLLMIVPPLVVTLMAAEREQGSPLIKEEVEAHVAKAPATLVTAVAAIQAERARGYADIEPRLAWEQWQIVRTTR